MPSLQQRMAPAVGAVTESLGGAAPALAVGDGIPAALARAAAEGVLPRVLSAHDTALADSSEEGLSRKPAGIFYDLDAWEGNLLEVQSAFGEGFFHASAMKSNGIGTMLRRARELGFGAECASIGEVRHAERLGFSGQQIVFDSPVKTPAELRYALEQGIHINIDNFQELETVTELRAIVPNSKSTIGLRVNPLVGAGTIAALSVSVADSKFGIPIDRRTQILDAFRNYRWLNCIHIHVGSGGMGVQVLVAGVKKAVELALSINEALGRQQVTVFDMGGGMPVNYKSELWHTQSVPSFADYAAALRRDVPALFPGSANCPFQRVVTEFGQSLYAKSGWLASRVEYTKPLPDGEGQVALIHFGADVCMRQCYTKEHPRRIEFYDGASMQRKEAGDDSPAVPVHVAGPLCFEGDTLTKDAEAPPLHRGDIVVMRECGANTLSLFSRHCSRQVLPAYGYRLRREGGGPEVAEWRVLKPMEDLEACSRHWGWEPAPKKARVG